MAAFLVATAPGARDATTLPAERVDEGLAQADSTAVQQARRILEDDGYQKSLPANRPPPELDLDLGPFAILVRILLWTGLGIALVVAVAWLASRLRGATGDAASAPEASAPAPLVVPLDSAERLASAGRFAEAIHALLLSTLAALSRAARLAPSLTSREIVARVPLPERAREALAGLVLAVEVSRFGGAPAGERDYRACLERFHEFLETYHRAGRRSEEAA